MGNDAWSVPSLEALATSGHDLRLVMTRVPRPAGRGNRLTPTPVADAARRLGLPLEEVETVKSGVGFEALRRTAPDVIAVVAYGEIVPARVLEVPKMGSVNLHFSLLPELRGAAPVQRALLEGLTVTGVTTILMDEGMDTGPVLEQAEERIAEDDDAGSLGGRLAVLGARLLVDTVDRLAADALEPRPQDEEKATYAPKLRPEERWLDWTEEAPLVVRRVRALAPDPAASALFRGDTLKVFRAEADEPAGSPGEITDVSKEGFRVGAGRGSVRPLEVAPSGRKRMTAAEFVRGFRPRAGERLEAPRGSA